MLFKSYCQLLNIHSLKSVYATKTSAIANPTRLIPANTVNTMSKTIISLKQSTHQPLPLRVVISASRDSTFAFNSLMDATNSGIISVYLSVKLSESDASTASGRTA